MKLIYLPRSQQLLSVEQTPEKSSLVVTNEDGDDVPHLESLPPHLQGKVYIVDSVYSGTGREGNKQIWEQVLQPVLDLVGVNYEYCRTTSPSTVTEYAKTVASNSTVVFISGDTSINEFINGLPPGDGTLFLFPIPLGTGNSFSLALGIKDEWAAIRQLLTSTEPRPLNLYEVAFPPGSHYYNGAEISGPLKFFVVFSWAFHASLVADSDTPEYRKMGMQRFQAAARENLKRDQRYEGVFKYRESDSQEVVSGPFAYFLVTPSQRFEPTFEISPKGNIFENSLYLVAFKTEDDEKYIIDIMGKAYNKGAHVEDERVEYRKISSGKLEYRAEGQNRRFCVDGSIVLVPEGEGCVLVESTGSLHRGWTLKTLNNERSELF